MVETRRPHYDARRYTVYVPLVRRRNGVRSANTRSAPAIVFRVSTPGKTPISVLHSGVLYYCAFIRICIKPSARVRGFYARKHANKARAVAGATGVQRVSVGGGGGKAVGGTGISVGRTALEGDTAGQGRAGGGVRAKLTRRNGNKRAFYSSSLPSRAACGDLIFRLIYFEFQTMSCFTWKTDARRKTVRFRLIFVYGLVYSIQKKKTIEIGPHNGA